MAALKLRWVVALRSDNSVRRASASFSMMAVAVLLSWTIPLTAALAAAPATRTPQLRYDIVIRNGVIFDGSGQHSFVGDVAIIADHIAYVGHRAPGLGREEIDASNEAVAPGFINMLAHPEASLLVDGRA